MACYMMRITNGMRVIDANKILTPNIWLSKQTLFSRIGVDTFSSIFRFISSQVIFYSATVKDTYTKFMEY